MRRRGQDKKKNKGRGERLLKDRGKKTRGRNGRLGGALFSKKGREKRGPVR